MAFSLTDIHEKGHVSLLYIGLASLSNYNSLDPKYSTGEQYHRHSICCLLIPNPEAFVALFLSHVLRRT